MDMFGIKSKTARCIAKYLDISYNSFTNSHLIIRWGSTLHKNLKTLNSSDAVKIASNKPLTRKILFENGIPVPKESKTNFPLVGRPMKHHGGKRFFYCENDYDLKRAEVKGAVYFSEFYNKEREYRVHIGSGKVILFSVKMGDRSARCWNVKNGFTFRHLSRSEWEWADQLMEIQRVCKKAVKSIGLDFGAVDVMASDKEDQKFVITEINTAPGLSPLGISKYVKYFQNQFLIEGGDIARKKEYRIGSFEVSSPPSGLIIPHKYDKINNSSIFLNPDRESRQDGSYTRIYKPIDFMTN